MQRIDGRIVFSPHDLINFMQCEFITWMDRRFLDDKTLVPDESDDGTKLLQEKGFEHEREFVRRQVEEGKSLIDIADGGSADQIAATIEAMRQGFDIVYQGALRSFEGDVGFGFGGISDFLYRCEGDSWLGDYYYDVRDTKLAKAAKPEFLIQLCCYADLLEKVQGRRPERLGVVLGTGETKFFATDDYFFFYLGLKKRLVRFVEEFDPSVPPDDVRELPLSRWNTEAKRIIAERDMLSQVANIRRLQIRRLKDCGINTVRELATSELHFVPKMGIETFETLKRQARLQIQSDGSSVPAFELLPRRADERRGLACLPPADPFDVWFDMEGYPHVEGGLEYLFGASHAEGFRDFWAHDRATEKVAFEQFVDWVFSRWKQHPGMHIYHYANYEVAALRRLMGRHGTREFEIDELLRNDIFVDLFQVVRQSLCVGEPSYSIKYVEHLYRAKRAGDVATAMDSIVFYERWLVEHDGEDWKTSAILNNIREYNRADCESTMDLTIWLRERQNEAGIEYLPKRQKSSTDDDEGTKRNPRAVRNADLAERMLKDPANENLIDEDLRIKTLLAHLLQFHEREMKPFWWSLFDRLAMLQEELILDCDCLGGLARSATPPRIFKTARAEWTEYEYDFDKTQDTKLSVGATCCLSFSMDRKCEITALDRESGKVSIKIRADQPEPHTPFGLIPFETFNQQALQDALYELAELYDANGAVALPKCIVDFLHRRIPDVIGGVAGRPLIEVLLGMQQTALCVQGPPGSGKTTTAANVISDLLARGHRVGITSNSHKCIENLINKCAEVATARGIAVSGAKIGADSDGANLHPDIKPFQEKLRVFPPDNFNLIGGTAYAFCIPAAIGAFDYLFVDEAGQMSIANLAAVSRCTRNIIMLGDQMQLEQPVQGFHPGESGTSTLEYYMGGRATIDEHHGVFLGTTYRMHPDVCRLISAAVYESKLHSASAASHRVLHVPANPKYVNKEAGLIYVPVEHDGNIQGSEEEAKVIQELVHELLICRWHDGAHQRSIRLEDILIVAPYNMQVRLIREMLPDGARVGSVDKLQGQEAPVVILSMCSSDANASPRGLPFLFSRNRLNVAISRAMTLAIVVASPRLIQTECNSIEQMNLANFFCRIAAEGSRQPSRV